MTPSATTDLPPPSALQTALDSSAKSSGWSHSVYLHDLASNVLHDLQYQHDWTSLFIHTHSPLTHLPLPRPLISGLPPRRAYIHPDEQIEILKAEHDTGESIEQHPEQEWVLPTHLQEKWSIAKFTSVFDAITTIPPGPEGAEPDSNQETATDCQWQGRNRQKRLLLATLHDDSTIVYYIMHDGLVKPRQN